jgi:CheY-like chemotaxis protein
MSDAQDRKTILICDDDDLLREFYARVLKAQGYDTLSATNGDEAIAVLESGAKVSAAIVDLLMPVRSGWELIEYMKAKPALAPIPVVAITGLATSFDEFEKRQERLRAPSCTRAISTSSSSPASSAR